MSNKEIAALVIFYVFIPLSILIPILLNRKHKSRSPKFQFGGLTMLKDVKELNVKFDFSQSTIKGLTEEDFLWSQCSISKIGDEWREHWRTKCMRHFLGKFCLKANQITHTIGLKLGDFSDAKYTALFQVQIVDEDGSTYGIMNIIDNSSGKTVAILNDFYGQGGRVGSIENLIGDAMERLGEKFGNLLFSELR